MRKSNPAFTNGVPELLILQLLSQEERYGYELVKAIQVQSRDAFNFGEGCIYPILHYLEETKLLTSRSAETDGRTRHYYHLTAKGKMRLAELKREWQQVTIGVNTVLGGSHA